MSHASLFLGPRSATGIFARCFGPLRDHVSRPAGSTSRLAGKRRCRRGGHRLAVAPGQNLCGEPGQVQEVRRAIGAGPPPRPSEQSASLSPKPSFFPVGHESLRFSDDNAPFVIVRNTTTRTYLRTSSATSVPCREDTCRILHAVTLASSSTCTLSSPTPLSVKSPCFAHTSILLISLIGSSTIVLPRSSVSLFRPFATTVVS